MNETDRSRPSVDPRLAANRIADLVAAPEVRGGLALFALRRTLRWALARASIGAREAAQEDRWSTRASDMRLGATSLRHVAWTAVLEDEPHDRSADGSAQTDRAASLIVGALEFRAHLTEGACPARLREHCERLFGTTLVPRRERFEVHRGGGRHVLVGVDGTLRAVAVLDASGAIRAEQEIAADLRACVRAEQVAAPAVLSLSTGPRPPAAVAWRALTRSSPEAAGLLSEALFSVFLDASAPGDIDGCGRLAQGGPAASRCFWHALQLVVFRNAKAALVGSFVAGVEGEGAVELATRLGTLRRARDAGAPGHEPAAPPPPPLDWRVDARTAKDLEATPWNGPWNAGGFVRLDGFGRKAWTEAGVSAEPAIVVGLRLALVTLAPDLDELECMVNLGHVHHGIVTRLGSTTPEMRAFLEAAGKPGEDLRPSFMAALTAHRARVRAAKRLESGEVALEFASFALARLEGVTRALLGFLVRVVAMLIAWRTPPLERPLLTRPLVAIDSSAPYRPGVAAFGRFGVLAPLRSNLGPPCAGRRRRLLRHPARTRPRRARP